jgi:hypothetical protein
VGKGNHSVNHIQKIKPRVEQICQELGLQYATEANEGRIYVNLTGGPATMPPQYQQGGGHHQPHHAQQHHGQETYGGQQQYGGNQQQTQVMEMEETVKKALPAIFRLLKSCCTVM